MHIYAVALCRSSGWLPVDDCSYETKTPSTGLSWNNQLILQQVDPVGVKSRRRHRLVRRTYISLGPNHLWHTDGYDKLRLYVVGCLSTETGSVPPTVLLNMFNQAYFLRCGRVNSLTKIIHEYRYWVCTYWAWESTASFRQVGISILTTADDTL